MPDEVGSDAASRQSQEELRAALAALLDYTDPGGSPPALETVAERSRDGYLERRVRYASPAGGDVPAFLLIPRSDRITGAVVVFHQHNSQWHLGKSEVVGLAGDPLQAFGTRLAERGIVVLAPDSIGFEDRRRSAAGTGPRPDDAAFHLVEFTHRLVAGRLLISDLLADAGTALSVVLGIDGVDAKRVGIAGHSYGGHLALFHAALDLRVQFACVSGAAGSYRDRINTNTGIALDQAIPGILDLADFGEIAGLVAPRPLHLVSATDDRYAHDAPAIEATAKETYRAFGAPHRLDHLRVQGGHALDEARSRDIVEWLADRAAP